MGDFYFTKAVCSYGRKVILVFEQGGLGKPICTLDKFDIEKLNREWKAKMEEVEF